MPRVPFQTLTAVRQNEAPIQSGAFQQTAQATSNLMSAIGGAAKTVQAMFDQAQDLKNRSDIMEKRRTIRMAQGEFLNEMAGMQKDGTMGQPIPPEQWGRLWQDRLKNLQKDVVEDKDAPPAVRRNIEEVFKDFSGSSFIQIAGAALKETRRNGRQNYDRDFGFYMSEGQTDKAKEATEQAWRDGFITEKEKKDVDRAVTRQERDNTIRQNMVLDPFQTAKDIKEGKYGLSDIAKNKWLEEVDSYQRTQERQALRDANDMIVAGEIEDETQLREFLDGKPEVSETTKKGFIKNFNNTKPLTEVERTQLRDKYDELILFNGDPKEYEKKFDALSKEYEVVKQRTGRPYLDLPNRNPQYYEKKFREGLASAHKDRFKWLEASGRNMVKPMVEARVKAEYAGIYKSVSANGVDDKDIPANKKFNALKKGEEETKIAAMRSIIDRKVEEHIAGLPPGADYSVPHLQAWLDENIDKFMLDAINEYEKRKAENELQESMKGLLPGEKSIEPRLKTTARELEGPGMLPGLGGYGGVIEGPVVPTGR